jgi:hypothetical protein
MIDKRMLQLPYIIMRQIREYFRNKIYETMIIMSWCTIKKCKQLSFKQFKRALVICLNYIHFIKLFRFCL